MDVIDVLVGYREIYRGMYDWLRQARKDILLSANRVDVNIVLRHSATLREVLMEATNHKDVNVRFIQSAPLVPLTAEEEALQILPSARCRKISVPRFGPKVGEQIVFLGKSVKDKLGPETTQILEQGVYSYQHSFILIDSEVAIIGCLGLDPEEHTPWYDRFVQPLLDILPNANQDKKHTKSLYHSVAFVVRTSTDFLEWANDNWTSKGLSLPRPGSIFAGSFGRGMSNELDYLHAFVRHTKEYLYIETELFYSNDFTHNQVARAIAHRIASSLDPHNKHPDPFVCIILTNLGKQGLYDQVLQTVDFMRELWRTAGIDEQKAAQRFFIGHLMLNGEKSVEIKGSVLIRDGTDAWVTTSGLHDAHMVRKSLRVGVHVQSRDQVQKCLNRCLARHLHPVELPPVPEGSNLVKEAILICHDEKGSIRKIRRVGLLTTSWITLKEFSLTMLFGDAIHAW